MTSESQVPALGSVKTHRVQVLTYVKSRGVATTVSMIRDLQATEVPTHGNYGPNNKALICEMGCGSQWSSVNDSETPKYKRYSSPTTPLLGYWHHGVSTQTVRNRLHGVGLYARRPLVCVRLTSRHRCDRRERIFIWRDRDSRNNPAIVHESVRFGGGGVLVYGGISIDGCTDLYIIRDGSLTARRYRDEILRPIVVPYAAAIEDDFILMDDNCRQHRANLVDDSLFEEGIVRMEWPVCSPDMNPIEHVWDALGRRVAGRHPPNFSKNWKELFWKSGAEYPNS
ncbi:transposable element Tcb2 transposase [Trichonephila clavipes]|nr:transposable element Tcb2 transposase [Trichonephila clavipes]